MLASCKRDKYAADDRIEIALDLVLPKAQYGPSHRAKFADIRLVAASILFNLELPKWADAVPPRWETPAMPKITLNKNCDPVSRKYDIGSAWQCPHMLAKSEAPPVEIAADERFQRGVFVPNSRHA